ncbi:putative DUF924-domain-containing protein [Seiridium cardinale]|uniref:DUF924-domain-containing protein n=1 Tax=Seiridium cardinale TaxID=138064 RepID=A0ABR2XSN5_9PEZI
MFRSTPDALSADAKASETATKAIAQDSDKQVTVIQASAFYMPLIQRESLISVIAARCLFEALMARYVSKEERDWVDMGITASKKHIQQLERFGRYPTRNAVLGRRNTEAEDEFSEECSREGKASANWTGRKKYHCSASVDAASIGQLNAAVDRSSEDAEQNDDRAAVAGGVESITTPKPKHH